MNPCSVIYSVETNALTNIKKKKKKEKEKGKEKRRKRTNERENVNLPARHIHYYSPRKLSFLKETSIYFSFISLDSKERKKEIKQKTKKIDKSKSTPF